MTSRETTRIIAGHGGRGVTPDLRIYIKCQFSNWMSSSQFQCHRDVINDTKVRIGANTSGTAWWRRGAGASAWVPSTRSRNRRLSFDGAKVAANWAHSTAVAPPVAANAAWSESFGSASASQLGGIWRAWGSGGLGASSAAYERDRRTLGPLREESRDAR